MEVLGSRKVDYSLVGGVEVFVMDFVGGKWKMIHGW